jgi:chromosome segregation ATPase
MPSSDIATPPATIMEQGGSMLGYKIFRTTLLTLVVLALGLGQVMKARADTARRDSDDQRVLARAQYLLKQVSAERDSLKADNAQLKQQLDAANAKSASQHKTAEAALTRLQENSTSLNDRLREAEDKNRELTVSLQSVQNEAGERTQQVMACAEKNLKLYQVSLELTDRYRSKGMLDALLQKEPVTQLKRVEIDNIAEQYRDLLDELKVQPPRAVAAH